MEAVDVRTPAPRSPEIVLVLTGFDRFLHKNSFAPGQADDSPGGAFAKSLHSVDGPDLYLARAVTHSHKFET